MKYFCYSKKNKIIPIQRAVHKNLFKKKMSEKRAAFYALIQL